MTEVVVALESSLYPQASASFSQEDLVDEWSSLDLQRNTHVVRDGDRVVGYGETGRARLTTLTKEFFMPGFLERDEGEREKPCEQFPWDGISGTRPFRRLAEATTVGVY